MNYTEKYHLPQWQESDRVMRTDFNQMCADIDEGIAQAQEAADTLPYVMGSYVGKGTGADTVINVGFRPAFVLIFCNVYSSSYHYTIGRFNAFSELIPSSKVTMTDTGFVVKAEDPDWQYPRVNVGGDRYQYVAFK